MRNFKTRIVYGAKALVRWHQMPIMTTARNGATEMRIVAASLLVIILVTSRVKPVRVTFKITTMLFFT